MKKIILCSWCINGFRSHGEEVYVGSEIDYDEYDGNAKCEFCEEDDDELYECII